ncbi:MAG: DnaB-like helicase N-terminal domain-containing protein, partial [bacterium]|nr:DnaB-like helicase N-terminal domain-containing protein [bacterium]
MFERLPPYDVQAEESVVASLLVDNEAIFKVAAILRPDDFFREANAWTFEACLALWERNEAINQITVAHELDRRGRLEEVGGLTFLSQLITDLPTPVGVEHYAHIVKRDATYRLMVRVAG